MLFNSLLLTIVLVVAAIIAMGGVYLFFKREKGKPLSVRELAGLIVVLLIVLLLSLFFSHGYQR